MHWQILISLFILAIVFYGLVRNWSADALMLGGVILFTVTGIITPKEAVAGFSNMGMLTVGALYIVAAALRETGALSIVGRYILGHARTERGALLRLAGSVTVMSAFLNNTPIVAMFIPIINEWCRRQRIAASKLLLPLSYLCIFGGTCTLIGTSTNLVVNGLMEETVKSTPALAEPLTSLKFFELGYVGVPYAIIGILYLLFYGQRKLPARRGLIEDVSASSRDYLVNIRIESTCSLVKQTVEQAGLRHLPGLFLVEIQRGDEVISPVQPDQFLAAGDILTFTGAIETILDLKKISGLVPVADEGYVTAAAERRRQGLCEAVISRACPSVGKTIREADFRARYNAAVIAVHRGGQRLAGKVGDIRLRAGDTLLLQAGSHFIRANRNNPHFLLVSGIDNARPVRHDRALYALFFLIVLVTLMVTGWVSTVLAAFLVAGLMVVFRCIDMTDARRSIDWQTLLTIAAAFGLSKGLVNSGLVSLVAEGFVNVAERFGPYGILASIYLMTTLFTETVTNNAAAALIFPFAVTIGTQVGVSPRPLVMAVVFAASASFMTPLGYQTNLMVYGPGGYRFTDFIRVGLPLNLLLMVCATILIPIVWPF